MNKEKLGHLHKCGIPIASGLVQGRCWAVIDTVVFLHRRHVATRRNTRRCWMTAVEGLSYCRGDLLNYGVDQDGGRLCVCLGRRCRDGVGQCARRHQDPSSSLGFICHGLLPSSPFPDLTCSTVGYGLRSSRFKVDMFYWQRFDLSSPQGLKLLPLWSFFYITHLKCWILWANRVLVKSNHLDHD